LALNAKKEIVCSYCFLLSLKCVDVCGKLYINHDLISFQFIRYYRKILLLPTTLHPLLRLLAGEFVRTLFRRHEVLVSGNTVKLVCRKFNVTTWIKDGINISYDSSSPWVLRFHNITESDSGTYRCLGVLLTAMKPMRAQGFYHILVGGEVFILYKSINYGFPIAL